MASDRYIVHIDMDAFFASVEQRDNPALRGKPVVVGADPRKGLGRGVVSTCSYEARKFGVHSAMPISLAFQKCPQAVFLRPDMEKYSLVSERIYEIFHEFTPDVEPVSIDEAFLDITGSFHLWGGPGKACLAIKAKIKEKSGLTSSLGMAPVKIAAKIASDLQKPDGYVEVSNNNLLDFLWPLSVGRIPGVGGKTGAALNKAGIFTIGDLAKRGERELSVLLGKSGADLWNLAWGRDERRVSSGEEAKSVSKEFTFEKDTADREVIDAVLLRLSDDVSRRLRRAGIKGKTVTLKIRLEGFLTFIRAKTIYQATNFSDAIYAQIISLYRNFDTKGRRVRLLGVKVSGFSGADDFPEDLFEADKDKRKENMYRAFEKIESKFGEGAIQRAHGS